MNKKFALIFILILCSLIIFAQPQMRIGGGRQVIRFKTKDDSVMLINVQQKIDELVSHKKFSQKNLDSLMVLQEKLFQARYFVTIYEPRPNYVPSDSLYKIKDLDEVYQVSVYRKNELPAVLFQCKNLAALEIINSSLNEIPKELNSLPHLTTLYLFNNTSKGRLKLHKNNFITALELHTLQPEKLPKSFKKLTALQKLDLSENKITRFPNSTRKNKKLIELSLQRNDITLNNKIRKHKSLERLGLQGNKIKYVPSSINNLPNLRKLNFNNNEVERVHNDIGQLQKIEQLSFYNNKLVEIPAGVYQMTSLREIDLFHNNIEKVEPQFANWQKLTTLYLSHNKLTALPENIDTLKFLTGIYVWENRIGALPESVGRMPQLQFLRINHNYLKTIPSSFYTLPNIEEIDFSHNYLSEIDERLFNYPNLKIIAIVNNPWTRGTAEMISRKTIELRKRNVFVHVTEE